VKSGSIYIKLIAKWLLAYSTHIVTYVHQPAHNFSHALSPFRFCTLVCPSVTWMDQSKTLNDRIMQFSPYSNPIHQVFAG